MTHAARHHKDTHLLDATPLNYATKAYVREMIELYTPLYAELGYPVAVMDAEITYFRDRDLARWRLILSTTGRRTHPQTGECPHD